jgi:hypothetical protein
VRRLFAGTQYQPDLYVAFIERAHTLTRPQGLLGLIVPTTFLTMHFFSGIRRYLLDHCRILKLVHFKCAVFADPTVESALCICQSEPEVRNRRKNTVGAAIVSRVTEFLNGTFPVRKISQASFEESPGYDLNLWLGTKEAQVVSRLRKGNVLALGALADMTVGLKPSQTGKGKPKQTKATVQQRVFDAGYRKDQTYRRYLMGRDLDRYAVEPVEERWISYGEWLAEPRPEAPFADPKRIIIRQTADTIVAAIEDRQFLTLNNIHNLRLKSGAPAMEYLLAVLNSKLISFFHQQVVPELGRVFAEVKIVDLQQLPIRQIEFRTAQRKRGQLLARAKRLWQEATETAGTQAVLDFVTEQLAAQPERAEVVHDLLTFRAEQMTALNGVKRAAARQFLTDLKDFHGIDARPLKPKTRLDQFWKLETAELFAHLRNNARALAAQNIRLTEAEEERIRSRLQKASATIVPLETPITFTDRLIDQIVYRLYGMTTEEIELVEKWAAPAVGEPHR